MKFSSHMVAEFYFCSFNLVNKEQDGSTKDAASPQLLSKLFPQTAVSDQPEVKEEQEKQKKQEEGCIFFITHIYNQPTAL